MQHNDPSRYTVKSFSDPSTGSTSWLESWPQRKIFLINWLHSKLFPCKQKQIEELQRKCIKLIYERDHLRSKLEKPWLL